MLRGHIGMVLQAQFGPDGKLLITKGAQDNTALVWDVASRRVVHRFTHDRGCSISPSGRTVLTISGEVATIHDTVTGSVVSTFPAGNSRILGMALSADDRLLATAHAGTILVLDLTTQKLIAQIKASDLETGNIGVRLALGPDGKRLAAATSSGPILLWDLPRGGGPVSLIGHLSETYALRFSPDGRTLASASLDDTIKLWDVERPGKNRTLLGHRGWVYAATWSADGRRVLSSGWDRTARIWDAGTGQELLTLRGNNAYVFDVAASPDGRLCATAGADSTVRIWDVAQALNLEKTLPDDFLTQQKKDKTPAEAESFLARHLTQECTNFFGHLGPVESVAFTAAGRLATTFARWHAATLGRVVRAADRQQPAGRLQEISWGRGLGRVHARCLRAGRQAARGDGRKGAGAAVRACRRLPRRGDAPRPRDPGSEADIRGPPRDHHGDRDELR